MYYIIQIASEFEEWEDYVGCDGWSFPEEWRDIYAFISKEKADDYCAWRTQIDDYHAYRVRESETLPEGFVKHVGKQ
jgi:ferritin-like protein